MQVSVETGEGLERRVRVELPYDQLQAAVEKRLARLAREVRLPGFRPGKVPVKVLRQRFGGQVEHEVLSDLVQSSLPLALDQASLRMAGAPSIAPEIDPAAGRFAYVATFEVMPEVELASLAGEVIKRPLVQLADVDLETVIERLREQRQTWTPVERPAQTGDRVTVSFTGTLEGESEPFEGGSASAVPVDLGSGRMIPGFEDGLIGASVGETRTLDLRFPEGGQRSDLADRAVRFAVTVESISEPVRPPVDADFVRSFGVEDGDLERFRSDVRGNLERELKQRLQARTKEAVMDLLLRTHSPALPAALVADEIRSMKGQMQQNLGTTPGASALDLPDALFEESARRRVTLGLIIGEIIRQQGLKAEPAQVRAAVEELASTYEDPKALIQYYYADRARLAGVESLVLETQVVEWALGQAAVEDEAMTFAEFNQSTMAQPTAA